MAGRDDDDDDLSQAADDKAIEDFSKEVGGTPHEEEPVVAPQDPDDRDDEPDEPRQTRKERKANRFSEAMRRADAAEQKANELQRRLDDFIARSSAQPPAQPAAPARAREEDDSPEKVYEDEDKLRVEYQEAIRKHQGNIPALEQSQFMKRGRELEARKVRALTGSRPQPQGLTAQDVDRMVRMAPYRDVLDHPQASVYAKAEYDRARALGAQPSQELYDKSMEAARKAFKLSGRGAPTAEARARYAGQSSARGQAATTRAAPAGIKITKEYKKMANAAYSHIPDEATRIQMWVNDVGQYLGKD